MKASVAVSVLVAITLGLSAWAGSQRASAGLIRPQTERSSRLLLGGRVRCTATVKSEVGLGEALIVKLTLHNIYKRPVTESLGVFAAGFVLKAADGTTYDSSGGLQGIPVPPPIPKKVRPGATIHFGASDVRVRWRGPLEVTPECQGKALPVLRVGVAAPWPGPNASTAVGQVVAAAGHLLDHCRPQASGDPVDGQIDPPSGPAPPMSARCSVSISSQGRFLVAQVLIVTPPGLTGVQIFQPYETLWPHSPLGAPPLAPPPYEAIAWEFVVTRDRAIPVAASSIAATNESSQIAPSFYWDGVGWTPGGQGSCGGTGFAWGGTGPDIEFISACTG